MKSLYYALMLAVVSACSLNALTPTPVGGSARSGANLALEQNKRACQGKRPGAQCRVGGGNAMFVAQGTCQPVPSKPGITGLATKELACTLGRGTAPLQRVNSGK